MSAGGTPRTMPSMVGLPRVRFATLVVGALVGGTLLLGPLSPPASASGPTTNCQLTALNNPSTVGEDATFHFFAAARTLEDVPPPPTGVVTFFDGASFLGTALLLPTLKDNSSVDFTTSSLSIGDHTI